MDSTRYKRRETQTRRPSYIGASAGRRRVQIDSLQPATPLSAATGLGSHQPALAQVAPAELATVVAPLAPRTPVAPTQLQPAPAAAADAPTGLPKKRLERINMGLPGDPSPELRPGVRVLKSRWQSVRRWALRSTVVILVLSLGLGGLLFSQGYLKAKKVFRGGSTSAAALKANVDPTLLKGEGDGRINVLLLGRGGGDHDAPDLTDTIMLASIDPVNHTATLLSLPRDLWVNVPGSGSMKINAAWETGKYKYLGKISDDMSDPKATQAGFTQIDQTVEEVAGAPIHYNVLVDFSAFKQAIDTVGGVDINVLEDLIDPTIAWENGNNAVIAKAGPQTFDGKRALLYARSRETSSDFARGERQRALLLGLKEKVKSLGTLSNPTKLAGLVSAFGNNVQSDLSINDASRLFGIVKDIDNSNVSSIGLAEAGNSFVTTASINGQSTVQPKAGMFNYTAIQNYVRGQIKDPYITKEAAQIMVLNGTTVPGLAGSQADLLKTYGYAISSTGNAPTKGYVQTVLVDLGHNKKYTKNYLEQRYNVTAVTALPDTTILPGSADFVIIVGNDASTTR